MDKYAAYRMRNVLAGRCPHCGEPCAPYYECEMRRFNKRYRRVIKRLCESGALVRFGDMIGVGDPEKMPVSYQTRRTDARRLPRYSGRPVSSVDDVILSVIDRPMTDAEVLAALGRRRVLGE